MRSVASELSIEWPPSMPIIDAMRPLLKARSTSAAVRAGRERLGPAAHHAMDDVDLFERGAHRLLALHRRRHVDRPELAADAALAQPRDVGHQLRHAAGDVGLGEIAARIESAQRPRVVVVAVDERHLLVQRARAGQRIVLARCGYAWPTIVATNGSRRAKRESECSSCAAMCIIAVCGSSRSRLSEGGCPHDTALASGVACAAARRSRRCRAAGRPARRRRRRPRPADAARHARRQAGRAREKLKEAASADVLSMYDLGQQMVDMVFSFGELGFQEFETQRYLTGILEAERLHDRDRRRRHSDGVGRAARDRASR